VAIKQIRKIPDELPAARLFLDDVEEITETIAQISRYRGKVDASTIKYKFGDRVFDTVEELRKAGGKTRKFDIEFDGGYLSIATYGNYFRVYAASDETKEEAWKAYSKIKLIFDHRASGIFSRLRNNLALATLVLSVVWFFDIFVWRLVAVRPIYHYTSEIIYWVFFVVFFVGTFTRILLLNFAISTRKMRNIRKRAP
jgi:hypothetical protein